MQGKEDFCIGRFGPGWERKLGLCISIGIHAGFRHASCIVTVRPQRQYVKVPIDEHLPRVSPARCFA